MAGTTSTAAPGVPSGVALLGMLQLTDSALPTGAFSHSLGLETYMSDGRVEGEEDFAAWLEMFVEQQLTFTDALAVRLVYAAENFDAVADLDELVTAQALPAQIREAGRTMGRRLLRTGAPALFFTTIVLLLAVVGAMVYVALTQGIAVAQPDLSHAGGISEVRRIASLAEVFGAMLAPHCPLGPISLASSLQVAFSTPNFLIQEQSMGIHYNTTAEMLDYLIDTTPMTFVNGSIERWEAPGLGVDVDEAAVRRADGRSPDWRPPVWRHADGSFAEW